MKTTPILPGLLLSCSLAFTPAAAAQTPAVLTIGNTGEQCQTLFAGQTIDAGTVCAKVVGSNLEITFDTIGGWELTQAHLWVGDNLAAMPQTRKGNPKIGNFPHNSGDITGKTSHSFSVPLTSLAFSCPGPNKTYYVAAHAALRKETIDGGYQTETGWAAGSRFVDRGSWATFFSIVLTCSNTNTGGGDGCETAFAYSPSPNDGGYGTSFADLGDFERWGWSIGALAPNTSTSPSYIFDIYAGAGQSDISKGTRVGTLTVVYNGSTAVVTYTMFTGFTLQEVHLYVGSEKLPRDKKDNTVYTVAPGQYPNKNDTLADVSSYQFTVNNLSGEVHVVAHAVVCSTQFAKK
ncbi:MAG: hypothetical protein ACYTF5_11655 [Planctomycetota bacterium]|jgi:hypothetical protein